MHKFEGLTLSNIAVDIRQHFEYLNTCTLGVTYVLFSRICSLVDILIKVSFEKKIMFSKLEEERHFMRLAIEY